MPLTGEIRAFAFDATQLERLGWVECDGRGVDVHTFPELEKRLGRAGGFPWGSPDPTIGSYNLPDLRGLFIRGWHHDRTSGGDPDAAKRDRGGNKVGSLQSSQNLSHAHSPIFAPSMPDKLARFAKVGGITQGSQFVVMDVSSDPLQTGPSGGSESRPVNAYVTYCIFVLKDTAG